MTLKEVIKYVEDSVDPVIECISPDTFSYTDELLSNITLAQKNKDEYSLEDLLNIASRDGLDNRYTSILCQLLAQDWHHSQEDIAMMLKEIKDPQSITALYERATNFLDYDDGRSLSRKCIWALGAVGSDKAKEKLILLKNNSDPIVSEVAALELDSKFDLP